MVNPELVEYAKNQLNAGSSANYIRTVLIKQGWSERDVDDALGIAQAEAGPPPAAAKPEPARAKPSGEKNKLLAVAGILTGIFLAITGGVMLYMLLVFGDTILTMETALVGLGMASLGISNYLIFGWIFAIIGLLAGVFWLITGARELRK